MLVVGHSRSPQSTCSYQGQLLLRHLWSEKWTLPVLPGAPAESYRAAMCIKRHGITQETIQSASVTVMLDLSCLLGIVWFANVSFYNKLLMIAQWEVVALRTA